MKINFRNINQLETYLQVQRIVYLLLLVKYIKHIYDLEGNLKELIDAKGQSFTYVYDELNRQTEAHYPDAVITTGYDENNNFTTITENKSGILGTLNDSTINTYDNFDRLLTSTERGLLLTHTYDNNGNRTLVSTPSGNTTYTYDNRNRLKTAVADGLTTSYTYYPDGKKDTVTYPNGTNIKYTYHNSNRIKTITNSAGGSVISSYLYFYDWNGNRISQTEVQNGISGITTYMYDKADRMYNFTLTDENGSSVNQYTFEGYNRKTEKVTENATVVKNRTFTYDETDWLKNIADSAQNSAISYEYDNNGNMTLKADSTLPDSNMTFKYDSRNQLVQTKRGPPASETILGQYDYNASGLRVRHRNSERGDVDYYYDDDAVIEEHNAYDNSLLAHYRYADRLLSLNTGSDTQYYHYDALGSTVNLTNSTGGTEVSYKLDPWGHIRSQSGFSVNRHIFTGQEYDEKTGLIYFGSRYYDPDVARFITQDSYLGEQGTPPSLHRYLYAYSNPTVYVDLMGYFNLSTHIRIAEEAYNDKEDAELQKQSGFSEKKELFIEALAKGAIAPDVVLITAETKSGMPSEELMAVDMMKVDRALNKFNNWFENLSVVQKYQAIKENIVDFAKGKIQKSFPKTYEAGEKGLYWWEDTSVLGPILNKASEYSSSAENVYQSHFGKEAWQHGMAVEGKSAKDIQDALVNNTANLIEVYRNSIAAGKYEEAGFALGIASHYLADTYTPSHTVRENDKITRFQNYKLQSPKLHGDADSPRTDSLVFKNAVDKTKLLIDVANNPLLNNDDLRKHLRENFYAITGKTKAEGTRKEYEIRLK